MLRTAFISAVALCILPANGQLTTSPTVSTGMNFQVQSGGATATKLVTITSTAGPTTLIITVPASQTWLTIAGNPAGTNFFPNAVPSVILPVSVNTTGLTTGQTLSANISIAVNNQPSTQVLFPVTLTVAVPSTSAPSTLVLLLIGAACCWIWLRWRVSRG